MEKNKPVYEFEYRIEYDPNKIEHLNLMFGLQLHIEKYLDKLQKHGCGKWKRLGEGFTIYPLDHYKKDGMPLNLNIKPEELTIKPD